MVTDISEQHFTSVLVTDDVKVELSGDSETLVAAHWKFYSVVGGNTVLQDMAFTQQKFCSEDECGTGSIPDICAECDTVYTYVFCYIHSHGVLFKCHQVL
jgi:hypothetical protein